MNDIPPTPPAPNTQVSYLPNLGFLRFPSKKAAVVELVAGLTVAVVAIPTAIAYAALMGLPPQYGLYATIVPLAVYPLFGGTRQVIVGPDIAVCLLMAGAIRPLAEGDPRRAAELAGLVGVLSGLLLVLGAKAKIGAVADFFSKPVLVGYMTGAALILMVSQLDKLLGLKLEHTDFFPRLAEALSHVGQINPVTVAMGVALTFLSLFLHKWFPRIPAALAVGVAAAAASAVFGLESKGVAVVGAIPRGLPVFAPPSFQWQDIHALIPAIVSIALLSYTEGILLARSFAAKNGYEVNPNQELVALGVSDVATGFLQGFPGTGSQSRTTVNVDTGAKTPVAGLAAAFFLAAFALFLTPLISHLPVVALGAILVCGGLRLVEFDAMKRIYSHYPASAALAALTTLGVLAAGVIPGILIGVVLSLLGLIRRISNPPDAVLREIPGRGFHDLGLAGGGAVTPGFLVYRFYAPLLFSNASHFAARVRDLVNNASPPVVWFLIDAQAITDVDVTASEMLHSLHLELQERGVAMKIAHANLPLRAILERTGLADELGEGGFFASVHECAEAFKVRDGSKGAR